MAEKGVQEPKNNKKPAQAEFCGITDFALYLFGEGTNYQAYQTFGAHPCTHGGAAGFRFCVWAPHAKSVSVVGSWNEWDTEAAPMQPFENTGVWTAFVPGVGAGQLYKYAITGPDGELFYKADPFAFEAELRPGTASVTCDIGGYEWGDAKWQRHKKAPYHAPMSIYEVHPGTWRRHEDGSLLRYEELADELVDYVTQMGYTHIELMPVMEHPFDGSWGYQVTGYYAATSRYGDPHGLMHLIDRCHQSDIGVILDWVPAHFPRDAHGLRLFDGTPLYEYADPRLGEHKAWGTLVFDFGKSEVVSFLISNARFWLDMYHADGLRVDAVSSMLYRDYDRPDGQWVANQYGGKENLEAMAFLQKLNTVVFADFPETLMIAEESTAWPKITKPVDEGGLGFNYKWNMGWMNDTLRYMQLDPYFRKFNHGILTFLMMYAFSENYILPLSHDEVVHGKKSLLDKMYGSYEEKFAQLKMYYAYMFAHPGKKLLFMGGEFGQFIEWRDDAALDWLLLDYDAHRNLQAFVRHLNHYYAKTKALWQIEDSWEGFRWINEHDEENSVLSFLRQGKAKGERLLVVCNFTPVARKSYRVGVPSAGEYEVVLRSDDKRFGGNGRCGEVFKARKAEADGLAHSLLLDLPGFTTLYLRKKPKDKKDSGKNPPRKKSIKN